MRKVKETNHKKSIWDNWGLILTIYIALKPLYFYASGTLQISDIFMIISLIYIIICLKGRFVITSEIKPVLIPLSCFVIFVCVINGLWTTTGYNYSRYSLYYIFNYLAFFLCYFVFMHDGAEGIKKAVLNGAFISGLITFVGLMRPQEGVRNLGFFNNPNQLGYYGIVLVSFVFLCRRDKYRFKEVFILIIGIWCVVLSLSKAAFLSLIIQFILSAIMLDRDRSRRALLRRIVFIILIGTLIYLFVYTNVISSLGFSSLVRMKRRLLNMTYENDTNLGSGRGYDRIRELGKNILWGMGEGNFKRFSVMKGAEVHSTYASLIVSYGIIGFLLYCMFVFKVIFHKGCGKENLAILSGILLYSISHNGVRNTLVWILLAIMYMCPLAIKNNTGAQLV